MKFLNTRVYILYAVIKSFDLFADNNSSWWFDPSSMSAEDAARLTSPEIFKGKNKFQNVNLYAYVFALFFYNPPFYVGTLSMKCSSREGRLKLAEGQSGSILIYEEAHRPKAGNIPRGMETLIRHE